MVVGLTGLSGLVTHEGQQGHETGSFNSFRYCSLTDGRATCFSASDDAAVSADQFLQEIDVLVINVHGARSFAVYVKRIFAYSSRLGLHFATRSFLWSSHERFEIVD